jgi:hypothetical protein
MSIINRIIDVLFIKGRMSLGLLILLLSQIGVSIDSQTPAEAKELKIPKSKTVLNTDIDGDGKSDRVIASYYTQPVLTYNFSAINTCQTLPGIFIRYTLESSKTRSSRVIFEYRYGTVLAQYWVRELRVDRDIDRNGLIDLVFYTGDDTSDEKVVLFQQQQGFKAVYLGSQDLPNVKVAQNNQLTDWRGASIFGYWQPQTLTWRGNKIAWVKGDCVMLRKTPQASSTAIMSIFSNQIVTILDDKSQANWFEVDVEGRKGWIDRRYVSKTTNSRWFR